MQHSVMATVAWSNYMAKRTYYGWEEDGKVRVSVMNATFDKRPFAEFDTREAAEEEVKKKRKCELTWEDGWRG